MAKSEALFMLVLCILSITTITTTVAGGATSTGFVVEKCRATRYATLCVESLSAYASKIQHNQQLLAQTALSVSLQRAKSTKAFIDRLSRVKGLRHREAAALKDCVEVIGDTVEWLAKSALELQRANNQARPQEFRWHISNVQTWVSAALTDDNTCEDGFGGRATNDRVKSAVNAQVQNVVHYTSNALALINQYASKHY